MTDTTNPENIQSIDSLIIDLSTLRAATENFDEANKLGEGGFGAVYKVLIMHYHIDIFIHILHFWHLNISIYLYRESSLIIRK